MNNNVLLDVEKALPIDPQPYSINSQRAGLIIVDEVNGFCTIGCGALAPTEANAQIDTMVSESHLLAKKFAERNWPILAFLDTHEPGKPEHPYPLHCEKGSGEETLVPELEWLQNHSGATLIKKDCINGFVGAIDIETGDNAILQWIDKHQLEVLIVVGICTDICVMDFVVTIMSVRNHGLTETLKEVVVYTKGCSTFDLTAENAAQLGLPKTAIHPQQIAHHVGLYTMAERGAFIASQISI